MVNICAIIILSGLKYHLESIMVLFLISACRVDRENHRCTYLGKIRLLWSLFNITISTCNSIF